MSARAAVPGDALLHPVVAGAVALLVVNDHVLKRAVPGLLTGKLSDLAGLVVLPALLVGVAELARGRAGPGRRRATAWAALAAAAGFAAVKTWPPAEALYEVALAALQWPVRAALAGGLPPLGRVVLVADPWDLLALPAAAVPVVLASGPRPGHVRVRSRRTRFRPGSPTSQGLSRTTPRVAPRTGARGAGARPG